MSIPKLIENPDLSNLIDVCNSYLEWLSSEDYHEDRINDIESLIFSSTMETFFGENVWNYINEKIV